MNTPNTNARILALLAASEAVLRHYPITTSGVRANVEALDSFEKAEAEAAPLSHDDAEIDAKVRARFYLAYFASLTA